MKVPGSEILKLIANILKAYNDKLWAGAKSATKVGKIIKTGV